jgi:hypothetical protein
MSKYSGQCDFGDTWEILDERTATTKVYFGSNIAPLEIHSYKDALPYFPYGVAMLGSSKESTTVILTTTSLIEKSPLMAAKKHYQKLLFDDMIKAGYDESAAYRWVYGFKAWTEKFLDKTLKLFDN